MFRKPPHKNKGIWGVSMALIQVHQLKKSIGTRVLLNELSFDIHEGDKIGLVGWNGAGKTTLVKILMGLVEPDTGTIKKIPSSLSIGYLPQSTEHLTFEGELNESGETLLKSASQLGLTKPHWIDSETKYLSGGEKLKLSLAKIWTNHSQCLLLDEPTNHLDSKGINWLITEVKSYGGAVMIISHDRYFLDQTVTKIFELEKGKLNIYNGNYSTYHKEKQDQMMRQQHDFDKQQRKIADIQQQVKTLRQWSDKAHREAGKGGSNAENRQAGLREHERVKAKKKDSQIKSKIKRLDLELSQHTVEKPDEEMKVSFHFESTNKHGKRIVEAKDLMKQYGKRVIFDRSYFYVMNGEKVGLMGLNGAGKTTLIKLLLGEEKPTKGTLWKSESMKAAYLSQDVNDLPLEKTALDYLQNDREKQLKARTLFANMNMKEDKLIKPMAELSLGERTRVKLVQMILQEYDLLILDEPTNHLDLPSREQLEETLESFTGTLIIVSHDRYLINKLCNRLLVIENQRIQRIDMGMNEYESIKNPVNQDEKERLEDLSVIETKITELLGKISFVKPGSEEYLRYDHELIEMMKKKQQRKG